jgi:carboxymethylenebutenolidase
MGEINLGDENVSGYLALPGSGEDPGVMVLHAWWGLNNVFKQFCQRLAAEGFVAFAPDLYHGAVATTINEAEQLSSNLNHQIATREIIAALEYLRRRSGNSLGVVGSSLGAFLALRLAQNQPEQVAAAVLFYGTGDGQYDKTRAAFPGHFAENDPYEPSEVVQQLESSLRAAGRQVTFHTYPGTGRWFFEPDRPEAAQLAWERTVKFLHEHLD